MSRLPGFSLKPTSWVNSVSVAPGAQVSTHAASPSSTSAPFTPVPPKHVQPRPGVVASFSRTLAAPPGGTAYTMAWCAISMFSAANWVPVRNSAFVRPGSITWHRYSSVPPAGGTGV